MLESDADAGAGAELAVNTYTSLQAALIGTSSSSQFSQINWTPAYSTSGITWDGSQIVVMLESDTDVDENELAFNTYASLEDLLAGTSASSEFSSIDWVPEYSTTGITWDGTQFIVMLESDADVDNFELGFNTYKTLDDILFGNVISSEFSAINWSEEYSTTGITWDGKQFIVMLESDADVDNFELGFNTYGSLQDLLDGTASSSEFSTINWAPGISTSGLYSLEAESDTSTIPLPASAFLLFGGIGAIGVAARRKHPPRTAVRRP